MAINWKDPDLWSGIGGAAGGAAGLFGGKGKNPADVANQQLSGVPSQAAPWLNPYWYAGANQLPGLSEQYTGLMNDPGGKYNQIGQGFHESPGFKFALEQALKGNANAAAAGGMAGSPAHERENMQTAEDLANQDYYNWMKGATGLYGEGLHGGQSMANQGQMAGSDIAGLIAQIQSQMARNSYEGQASKNANKSGSLGDIIGGAAKVAGSIFF